LQNFLILIHILLRLLEAAAWVVVMVEGQRRDVGLGVPSLFKTRVSVYKLSSIASMGVFFSYIDTNKMAAPDYGTLPAT